jgi:LPXTG-motif cell wall-anchored protein
MKKSLFFSLSILVTGMFFSITKPLYPVMASAETLTVDYTPKLTDVFNFFGMSNDTEVEGVISRADAAYNVQIPQNNIELTSTFFLQSANSIANGGDGVDSWLTYSFTPSPGIDGSNNPAIPTNGNGVNGLFLSITNYSGSVATNTVEVQVVSRVGGVRTEVAKDWVDGAVNTKLVIGLTKAIDNTYTFDIKRASDSAVLKSFANLALDESVFINATEGATYFGTGMWTSGATRPTLAVHSMKTFFVPEPEVIHFNEVTDLKDMYIGGTYAIAAKSGETVPVMSTVQNTNNRGQAPGVIENGRLKIAPEYQLVELVAGALPNTYGFKTINGPLADKFLTTASSSSNYLRTSDILNNNSSWAITFASGVISVIGQGEFTRNVMQYNASASLFAAYSSASQVALTFYKAENLVQTSGYSPLYSEVKDFYGIGSGLEGGIRMAADATLAVPMNGRDIELVTTFNLQSANSVANGGDGVDTWLTYSFTKAIPSNGNAIPSNAHANQGLYFVITNFSGSAAPNTVEVQVHMNGYHDADPKFFLDNAVNTKIVISLEQTHDGKFDLAFKNYETGAVLFAAPGNALNEDDFVNDLGQTYLSTAMWTNNGSVRPTVDVFNLNKLATKASDVEVTLSEDEFVYNGEEQAPVVTVTLGDVVLTEGVDYTLDITDNLNVGTAQATVTLIGDYDRQVIVKHFEILAVDASDAVVTLGGTSFTFTGVEIRPLVSVVLGETILVEDVDYTVSYQNNIAIGTGHAVINFIGNYSGPAVIRDFTIGRIDASSAVITVADEVEYTGSALTPAITVSLGETIFNPGAVYDVSYTNNINIGTATVTVTFKGIYEGTISETFSIVPRNIASLVTVTLAEAELEHTGSALTPTVTIKLGDVTLVKDTDYQVSYTNNTEVGTATITITFKGNYAGTTTKTFTITAAPVEPTTGCFGSVSSSLAVGAVLLGLGGFFAIKRKKSII